MKNQTKTKNSKKTNTFLCIAVIFAIAVLFTLWLDFSSQNQFALGTKIAGIKIGGMDYKSGTDKVRSEVDKFEKTTLKFISSEKNFETETSLSEIGAEINFEKSLKEAYAIGKNRNFFKAICEEYLALFGLYNPDIQYEIAYKNLDFFFEDEFKNIIEPAQNASLRITENNNIETISSKPGRIISKKDLYETIYNRISKLNGNPIELKYEIDTPKIKEDELGDARELTTWLLGNSFVLAYGNSKWTISNSEIASYITFEPFTIAVENLGDQDYFEKEPVNTTDHTSSSDQILKVSLGGEKLQALLYEIMVAISKDAKNARFDVVKDTNGNVARVEAFELAENGFTLDEKATKINITKTIEDKTNTAQIITKVVEPEFKDNEAIEHGIEKLLGRSSLPLLSSPANRRHNITVGTSKINGVILKKGEEFSFNNAIGEISIAEGFKAELVIKENKVIPELGGGLCHISSSLFQATTSAGLEVTERHNHSFHVSYYGATPGYDATIYPPNVDYSFVNNTPSNVLIKGFIENDALVFEIYGTKDERIVEIDGPHAYDRQSSGAVKAWLGYKVTMNNNILQDKKFVSVYRAPGEFARN